MKFMKNSIVGLTFLLAVILASIPSDVRASAGDLYSGQLSNKEVDKFTPAGTKSIFVSGFFADALAFDVRGNLFVADTQRGKIVKVTPGGVATDFATIGNPMGLAFDAAGNLFVSDASTQSIIKLTPAGGSSTFASGLNGPSGLAFDRNGNLFVSETNTTNMGRIFKFTSTGTRTTFATGLNSPEGLAFDSAGNLYEVDFSSGKVFKFTSAGGRSTFATGLLSPRHIAIDQNDNVFVANFSTQEILKFTPTGTKTTFASDANSGGLAFEPPTAQLTNISTRASVGTGGSVTIAGFILTGTALKQVVVRGLGPTLTQFGVSGVLADPTLQLVNSSGNTLFINDNWKDTQQTGIQVTGLAPPNDLESAIRIALQPGKYTAILSGTNNTTGVGLVEVYDIEKNVLSALTNVSTRGFVGTDQNVMIAGFITEGGNGSTEVVVRGLGPTLTQFGVSGALADPKLTLVNSNGNIIGSNNNWKDTQQVAIQATGLAPPNDLEAAILATVSAGGYTAILEGNNGGTGIGLVEVYNVR
jgi:sugar lactone lactonase YvrE